MYFVATCRCWEGCMALDHFYNLLVKAIHALCTSLLANVLKNLFIFSKSLRNQSWNFYTIYGG